MHSRQFAILVLAIFISTLALAFGGNEIVVASSSINSFENKTSATITTPSTAIKVTAALADAGSSSKTESVSSTGPSSSTAQPAVITESSALSSPATFVKGELTTEASTTVKPSEGLTAIATDAPIASTTNPTKSTEVVNDHSIRDVSSEKCSTAYNAADKANWVPEKAILAVLEGNAVVTVDQLCKHLDVIKRLDAVCNNTNVKLDADDSKVAPIVAGLNSMFSTICSDTKSFSVPTGNSTLCVELIQSTTKKCSTNPHVFPTEVLFEEMVKESCTVVFNTKECIINGLGESDKCTEPQRAALKQAINMVTKVLPCSLPVSTETTPAASTEAPSTTTTTPTTTTPTVTTTKSHSHSSANGFQVNFFTVLPVLLLAFKFY